VKTHFLSTLGPGSGYNGRVVPAELAAVWNSVQHKEVQSANVKSIGEGDGGGGTLRADLEMARRLGDLEGAPRSGWKTVSAALDEIFADDTPGNFPEWRGELYLELHRGTYTTQARTKRNNRMLEFALRNTEFLCAFAALDGDKYQSEDILDFWKRTLTYQFHDIIPGSSIGRVYDEAEADSGRMLVQLAGMGDEAKGRLARKHCDPSGNAAMFVFNDLSWKRKSAVSVPQEIPGLGAATALHDPGEDKYHEVQRYTDLDGNVKAESTVPAPALGYACYNIVCGEFAGKSPFVWGNDNLETPFYKITFDKAGRIVSLFDKNQGREMVAPGGAFNSLITAEDVPVFWDAWDIDADWSRNIKQETQLVSTSVAADGSSFFRLRRAYEIGKASRLIQDMICYADNPRVDFQTKVSWNEKWRLLKVEFDTAVDTPRVRCEVQYGHIWRNTHRNLMQDRAMFEICAHKWISLEEEGSGIALMNDCKYGHDVEGGRMRLSLLRSPIAPDPNADRGTHYFTYSIMPFAGSFGDSGAVRSAYELNSPLTGLQESCAKLAEGTGLPHRSLCTVDGNAVIVECVKAPENGESGELVLRLYESLGGRCASALRFSREVRGASETDMLEDNPKPLKVEGKVLPLEFRPFEIKTLRVRL